MKPTWAAMAVALLAGCTPLEPLPPASTAPDTLPRMEIFGARVHFSRAGQTRFVLRAGRIRQFADRSRLDFEDSVRVDFYHPDGGHAARLTARRGEVRADGALLRAWGDVLVRSDSGLVVRTEELAYDRHREKVFTEEFVTVVTPDDSLSGYGLEASPDLSDWVIKNTSGATRRRREGT